MKPLTRPEARSLQETITGQNLSPEVARCIGGIGLCKLVTEPPVWGVAVSLIEPIDQAEVLGPVPSDLHDNVRFDTIGEINAQA